MNRILSIIIGANLMLLSGCSANVARYGYEIDKTKSTTECFTPIKLKAVLNEKEVDRIGSIKVYDVNLVSVNCDEEAVLSILRRDSCYLKADLINITEEKQPDYFWSVCYRVKADFLKFKDSEQARAIISDTQFEWSQVQSRGALGKQKGEAAYGRAVSSGAAAGLSVGAATSTAK